MSKTPVAFTWGRANPPTAGHEKLVKKVKDVAKEHGATPKVFFTHTQDHLKNPLHYDDKHSLARKAFGDVVQHHDHKTIMHAMKGLAEKHNEAHVVVGSDRVEEMHTLLNKYNGKEYHFDKIHVHSSGNRDPDAEGVEGMSASKMRAAATAGHKDTFKSGLPSKLSDEDREHAYNKVREGMVKPERKKTIKEEGEGGGEGATEPTNTVGGAFGGLLNPMLMMNLRKIYLRLKLLKKRKQFAVYRDDPA